VQVSISESLKADNTKLYEKVRYLQSYNNSSGVHARTKASFADRDLDLEALEQRYEASVDPFKQFSRSEKQRKVKEMSPMERTVYFVARTVLGSKEMRTGLFFYVVVMHLLVFFTTYHWSHGCQTVAHHSNIDSMNAGLPEMEEGS
jgi:homeobox protein cut-like